LGSRSGSNAAPSATETEMNERAATEIEKLPYAVPTELANDGWPTLVRAMGVTTIVVAAAYLMSAASQAAIYFTVGRYGRNWFQIASIATLPLYPLAIAGGVCCIGARPRRWRLVKWGLVAMLVAQAVVTGTIWAFVLLSATVYATNMGNIAGGAQIGGAIADGVAALVLPAALLWLATRPAVKRTFADGVRP
jgi:hypothetical protein